jgi:hypothetical protein
LPYLLSAVYIIIVNGGEEFEFWSEGILVTEVCSSVDQGSED